MKSNDENIPEKVCYMYTKCIATKLNRATHSIIDLRGYSLFCIFDRGDSNAGATTELPCQSKTIQNRHKLEFYRI